MDGPSRARSWRALCVATIFGRFTPSWANLRGEAEESCQLTPALRDGLFRSFDQDDVGISRWRSNTICFPPGVTSNVRVDVMTTVDN
jgi:hypothetical protein